MSAERRTETGEEISQGILKRISRVFFPLEFTLAGEAASGHLQTDPIGILQCGAFLIRESSAPGFGARVCFEPGASAGIHVNVRQKGFESAGTHTITS
jgi:hypothetical protein